jgi:hypothetical protein
VEKRTRKIGFFRIFGIDSCQPEFFFG